MRQQGRLWARQHHHPAGPPASMEREEASFCYFCCLVVFTVFFFLITLEDRRAFYIIFIEILLPVTSIYFISHHWHKLCCWIALHSILTTHYLFLFFKLWFVPWVHPLLSAENSLRYSSKNNSNKHHLFGEAFLMLPPLSKSILVHLEESPILWGFQKQKMCFIDCCIPEVECFAL